MTVFFAFEAFYGECLDFSVTLEHYHGPFLSYTPCSFTTTASNYTCLLVCVYSMAT